MIVKDSYNTNLNNHLKSYHIQIQSIVIHSKRMPKEIF